MVSRLDAQHIAQHYAKALFEVAIEQNTQQAIQTDLEQLAAIAKDVPEWQVFMVTPAIAQDEKTQWLAAHIQGQVHASVYQLLLTMLENDRIESFPEVPAAFQKLLDAHHNVGKALVTTAVSMDADIAERLSAKLAERFGFQRVDVQNEVDPAIIGGMVVRLQDKILDGSFLGRLQAIRQHAVQHS